METSTKWALGLAALAIVGVSLLARSDPAPVATDAPFVVIGDSFAVGIAAQLRLLRPGARILEHAKVGAASPQMVTAPDGARVIVSAGTNDAAQRLVDEAMLGSLARVLGPYAADTAQSGRLFWVVPHAQMPNPLGARVLALQSGIRGRFRPNARFRLGVPLVRATAPDGIHFDAAGYSSITQAALEFLEAP